MFTTTINGWLFVELNDIAIHQANVNKWTVIILQQGESEIEKDKREKNIKQHWTEFNLLEMPLNSLCWTELCVVMKKENGKPASFIWPFSICNNGKRFVTEKNVHHRGCDYHRFFFLFLSCNGLSQSQNVFTFPYRIHQAHGRNVICSVQGSCCQVKHNATHHRLANPLRFINCAKTRPPYSDTHFSYIYMYKYTFW